MASEAVEAAKVFEVKKVAYSSKSILNVKHITNVDVRIVCIVPIYSIRKYGCGNLIWHHFRQLGELLF